MYAYLILEDMIPKSFPQVKEEESNLFPLKIDKRLRKSVSDASTTETEKYGKNKLEAIAKIDEVEQVGCKCCGLKEECTQDYIIKIKSFYSGKWVCGLCSEAVHERLKRAPKVAIKEALRFHKEFCQEFNSTTRLNPKLSLTSSMRKIARRSCEIRNTTSPITMLARSSSCVSRFET